MKSFKTYSIFLFAAFIACSSWNNPFQPANNPKGVKGLDTTAHLDTNYVLKGRILYSYYKDSIPQSLSNVNIYLLGTKDTVNCSSNDSGKYLFDSLKIGSYRITFSRSIYSNSFTYQEIEPDTSTVTISKDTTTINFKVTPLYRGLQGYVLCGKDSIVNAKVQILSMTCEGFTSYYGFSNAYKYTNTKGYYETKAYMAEPFGPDDIGNVPPPEDFKIKYIHVLITANGYVDFKDSISAQNTDYLIIQKNFNISKINHAPVIVSTASNMLDSITTGMNYLDTIHATDIDSDTLTYKFLDSTQGMVLKDSIINWTPTAKDTGNNKISIRVSDGKGLFDTLSWIIKVYGPPIIITQPQSQTINAGQSVTFSVVATGNSIPIYQWIKNGNNISGATLSSYTIASVQASDSGSYEVVVSNSVGKDTSDATVLTVNYIPSITTHPQSQTINVSQSVSFTIAASGNPSPSYQWKKNGSIINGATNNYYTISSTQISDSGTYSVVITNSRGSVTSNEAILAVNFGPVITTQPQSQTIYEGENVVLSVVASGKPAPLYQWKKNGSIISGATNKNYYIDEVQAIDVGTYSVDITNSLGNVTSDNAVLTVIYAPIITTQPQSQTIVEGDSVTFTVIASGYPSPTYQWYIDGTPISDANESSYKLSSVQVSDIGTYTVVVANNEGNVASNDAVLSVNDRYAIGDTGPAGGIIFYINDNYSDGWRYLEAAPNDQSANAEWGCSGTIISGANGTAIGTGEQNTTDIEAGCATVGTAADICANLILNGYDDWFLPSKNELNLMSQNIRNIGGFSGNYYWSSSEYDADLAWDQYLLNGNQGQYSKNGHIDRVRAIRAF